MASDISLNSSVMPAASPLIGNSTNNGTIINSNGGATLRSQPNEPEKKGWLQKWTNYLKGYQKRYFVLNNGTLSYYRQNGPCFRMLQSY